MNDRASELEIRDVVADYEMATLRDCSKCSTRYSRKHNARQLRDKLSAKVQQQASQEMTYIRTMKTFRI